MVETQKRTVERPARRRAAEAADTSYVDETFTLVLSGRAALRVVDPATGRLLFEGVEEAEVRESMRRAVYDGDERSLVLTAAERRLFDREAERRAIRTLEEELVDLLADRIAERTYAALLDRID